MVVTTKVSKVRFQACLGHNFKQGLNRETLTRKIAGLSEALTREEMVILSAVGLRSPQANILFLPSAKVIVFKQTQSLSEPSTRSERKTSLPKLKLLVVTRGLALTIPNRTWWFRRLWINQCSSLIKLEQAYQSRKVLHQLDDKKGIGRRSPWPSYLRSKRSRDPHYRTLGRTLSF